MESQNGKPIKSNIPFPNFNYARRDFIKMCSAVTAGGISSLLLPQTSEAKNSLALLETKASEGIIDELFWTFVRSQFAFKPGLIYMNTGTEGSMPRCVFSRITNHCREFAANPMDAIINSELYGILMQETRTRVAEFLGADMEEIVLTTNTTEGFCLTANGLDLNEGDEILTTLHFDPYNCSLFILKDRRGVTITELELPTPAESKNEIIAAFEEAITPQTKVMTFCHINFSTGLVMPVKELCQLARDHNIISIVDGAHSIGMLNFNLHELGCDFYACSPHKWLCAPPGTGVLYMREDAQGLLWPTVTEGYPTIKKAVNLFQIRGQQCTPIYACLNDAIDFQNAIGKDKIQDRIINLSTYLKEKIVDNWGEEILFSPMDEGLSSGLVAFNPFDDHFDGEKTSGTFYELQDKYNVIIRTIKFKDKHSDTKMKRAIRISTHIYNNYAEIDRVLDIIKTIVATN